MTIAVDMGRKATKPTNQDNVNADIQTKGDCIIQLNGECKKEVDSD